MSSKFYITFGLIVGSTVGGYLPSLWGDSVFSLTSIILTFVGGLFGIWVGYRVGQNLS